jgi:acyl-CoA hydrolase
VILEVNPNQVRVKGGLEINIKDVTTLYEVDEPIPEIGAMQATDVEDTIGANVAALVKDGDTIQLGIGSLPDAVAHHLMDKKDLGLHTEMFTSSMGEMIRKGVLTGERKNYYKGVHIGSFAGGDRALYETMSNTPNLRIVPASYGVNPMTIMQNDNMVSINTILEMDLTGQVCSESIGPRQFSGSGGGFCFAYGALHSKGGRGILAFASRSKKGMPKIKATLTPGAAVTIPRNYVDYIVTEYGVAALRGRSVKERVEALVSIAHPDDREDLLKQARELFYI